MVADQVRTNDFAQEWQQMHGNCQNMPDNARYSAINSQKCQIVGNQFQEMPDIQQSIPRTAR
jgi:hypothetical protein